MNIYLNKKQKRMLTALIDSAENIVDRNQFSTEENFEYFMQTLMELKAKITGKKVAKNGVILEPIEVDCLHSDDKLIVRAREDGRAIILESKNRVSDRGGSYTFRLGLNNSILLSNYIIQYLDAWGIEYTPEDKAYSEEIHVFADGVERSITVNGGMIWFTCYTDDSDDYWTFLTPHKAKYFVELMLGYIHSVQKEGRRTV